MGRPAFRVRALHQTIHDCEPVVFPVTELIPQVFQHASLGFQELLTQLQQPETNGADISLYEWAVMFNPQLPAFHGSCTGIVLTLQIVLRDDPIHDALNDFDLIVLVGT